MVSGVVAESRHHLGVRWVLVSVVVHVAVLAMLVDEPRMYEWHPPALPQVEAPPTVVEIIDVPRATPGGGGHRSARRHVGVSVSVGVSDLVIGSVDRMGQGEGEGGHGTGNGIGLGDGAVVRIPDNIPPAPPPPRISKARPAKLIWPNRDEEVDDDANLFVASVTVDSHGDVIGARMRTVRPGAKAARAADAIWTFRYLPALDDDGNPVNSTLDQSFQVR